MEFLIKLDGIEGAHKFVQKMAKWDGNIDLVQGRYTVNASSILGILSLDLRRPMKLKYEYANDAFVHDISSFVVGE